MVAAAFLVALTGQVGAQTKPGNAADGQKLVQEQCIDCHPVDRPTQASQKASSLAAIANMRSTTSISLHVFLQTPHYKMPNYRLTSQEIDDVVAYILSLHSHGTQESGDIGQDAASRDRGRSATQVEAH
jgi:mono/diheme cytochrome c family protein